MIKKDTLLKMAAILKMDAAEFEAAFNDAAEKDITLPEVTAFTATELSTRDSAIKKTERAEATTAALEMFIKDQKKTLGIEFDGKDPAKFLEAFQAKVLADAKVTPDEVVKKKDAEIGQLKANIQTLQKEKEEAIGQVGKIKTETTLMGSIPTNLNGVEPQEVLASMRLKGYDFVEEDGVMVAKKDGVTIADKLLKPINLKDVITTYATERKWIGEEDSAKQGRGAASSKKAGAFTGKPSKLSEVEQAWKDEGKNTSTADFQRHLEGIMAENKDFDINS